MPGGRPRKEIDFTQLDKLIGIQCNEVECAAYFGMSVDILAERIKEEAGQSFPEYFKQKAGSGKISLRRAQMRLALGDSKHPPNPTMLIWLGKQHLGQKDKQEVEATGSGLVITVKQDVEGV